MDQHSNFQDSFRDVFQEEILVVVATIKMKTLNTEVEKGSM